jgi:hypothetical protein
MRFFRQTMGLLLIGVLIPAAAAAQSAIAGVVKDTTGGVLPGVTVEASSPALIEKARSVTTDERGQYKIVDLRPGVYTVTFTLPGFSTVKRDGVELTASFTAPVNADMRIGAVEETITVAAESPIVDTQRIVQQKVMTRDVIDAVPTGRTFQTIGVLVPGVTLGGGGTGATPYDVGGSTGEGATQMAIHGGATADMVMQMDGMRFNNLCGSGSYATVNGNDALVEQISYETGAISAEMGTGGIRVNMIPKEGGNTFKGQLFLNGASGGFQSDNFSDTLKNQGLVATNRMKQVWDLSGALGGPLKKDRLWFLFATRYWGVNKYPADSFFDADPRPNVYAPDRGRPGIDDSWNTSNALRLTAQLSARNKLNLFFDPQARRINHWFIGQGGIFGITTPEASWIQRAPHDNLAQLKWSSSFSSRMLFEAGFTSYAVEYTRYPVDEAIVNGYSVRDNATGRRFNAAPYYSQHFSDVRTYIGSLSYVTGSHAFKTGFAMTEGPSNEVATVNNDVTLVYNGTTATQAILTASPRNARDRLKADLGLYVQDQWTLQQLTLNLGLRYDYFNSQLEDQQFAAGTYVPARTLAAIKNLPSWKDLNPRIGASYDLFGNGKTAVKTSLSRYVASQTVGFARQFNPLGGTVTGAGFNGAGSDTRIWTDPNQDGIPQFSELGPTSNPSFGLPTLTTTPSPDVQQGWSKRGFNWEYSGSVQHALTPRVALNAAYFRRWFGNFTHTDALGVGPSNYDRFCVNAPSDARLPGGGGYEVCGFDVTAAARPLLAINRIVDFADPANRSQVFNGIDATVSARLRGGVLLSGGTSTGRTVTKNCETFDSPDTRFCTVTPPVQTQVKLLGSYTLPYDVQVSGVFQSIPGPALSASWSINNTVANAGPSPLGRNLSANSATLALIAPSTLFGDRLNQVDLRAAKSLRFGQRRLQLMVDVYNALNKAPVLSYNTTFGPEWLRPTDVLQGRLAKLGAQLMF